MDVESKTTPTPENKWFWNVDEDGLFKGPFDSKDVALEDAIHGNDVFGNDENIEAIYLINGHTYPNPDYDKEYPSNEENPPEHITGKPISFTKSEALEWCLKEIDALRKEKRRIA